MAPGTLGWATSGQTPLHRDRADWVLVGLGCGLIMGRKDYSRNGVKGPAPFAIWPPRVLYFWPPAFVLLVLFPGMSSCLRENSYSSSKPRCKSTSGVFLPPCQYSILFPTSVWQHISLPRCRWMSTSPWRLSSPDPTISFLEPISLVSTLGRGLGRRKRGL